MLIHFDTNELTPKDAQCLVTLLSHLAGEPAKNHREKESVVRSVTEVSEMRREREPEEQALKDRAVEDAEAPAKKRGRPRKEQTVGVPVVDFTQMTPETSSEPAFETGEAPITIEALRDIFNEHVSRHDMPSALAILNGAGCKRVTDFISLDGAKQKEVLALLKK